MDRLLYRHLFVASQARDEAFDAVSWSAEKGHFGDVRIDHLMVGPIPGLCLCREESAVTILKVDVEAGTSTPRPSLEFRVSELKPPDVALAFDCLVVANLNPSGMVWLSGYALKDFAAYPSATLQEIAPGQSGVLLSSADFLDYVS